MLYCLVVCLIHGQGLKPAGGIETGSSGVDILYMRQAQNTATTFSFYFFANILLCCFYQLLSDTLLPSLRGHHDVVQIHTYVRG